MASSSPARTSALRGVGGNSRSGLLDLVRLFASFDIVAYHTGAALGDNSAFRLGIGIAIFLIMNAVSVGNFEGERSFFRFLSERSKRYLTPFLFWYVVYAVLQTLLALRHDATPFGWFEPRMLWQGTYYHLWFMPVALGLSLATELLRRATRNVSDGACVATILLISPLLLYVGPGWLRSFASRGWYPWVWIIPAVPFGVAFGRLLALPRTPHWNSLILGFAGTFAAMGVGVWQVVHDTLSSDIRI